MGYVATGLIARSRTFGAQAQRTALVGREVTTAPTVLRPPRTTATIIPKPPPLPTGSRTLFPGTQVARTDKGGITVLETAPVRPTRAPVVLAPTKPPPTRAPAPAVFAPTKPPPTRAPAPAVFAPTKPPPTRAPEPPPIIAEIPTVPTKAPPLTTAPVTGGGGGGGMWGGAGPWSGSSDLAPIDELLDQAEVPVDQPVAPPKSKLGTIALVGAAALAAAYAIWGT